MRNIFNLPILAFSRIAQGVCFWSWYYLGFKPAQTATLVWLLCVLFVGLIGFPIGGLIYLMVVGFFIILELLREPPPLQDGVIRDTFLPIIEQHSGWFYFISISCLLILVLSIFFPDVLFGQLAIYMLSIQIGGKGGKLWDTLKVRSLKSVPARQ